MRNEPDDMTTDGDYYEYEPNYKPKKTRPIGRGKDGGSALRTTAFILAVVGLFLFLTIQYATAQEVCKPKQPDCIPPTIQSKEGCGKWFKPFQVSEHYYEGCIAKLPRLIETNATDEAKLYFFCLCEFKGSVLDRRDP